MRGLVLLLALAACGGEVVSPPALQLGLRVVPESMRAAAGHRCVLLVTTDLPPTLRSATIAAHVDAPFNLVGRYVPGGGAVAEIEIETDGGRSDPVRVVVAGAYENQTALASATVELVSWNDGAYVEARARLDGFLPFLEEQLPDEGIDGETRWSGAPVVGAESAFLFFSTRWEVGLTWNQSWTRLYLRRRFAEARPSRAFRRTGYGDGDGEVTVVVSPPAVVLR